jgi:hypothetical protein
MAREMDLATIKPLGSQIAEQIAADRERLKQITEGFSSIRLMSPLLEAERERRERLAELLNPWRRTGGASYADQWIGADC